MTEEVEISVVLKLPKGHYQVATGLTRIYDYANFDEYVSETIRENVETLLDGTEPLDDYISHNLTGKPVCFCLPLETYHIRLSSITYYHGTLSFIKTRDR